MNEPDYPYYKLDNELDDSEPWVVEQATCAVTGIQFVIVFRVDQKPICPICHPKSPRVTRVSEDEYDAPAPRTKATPTGPIKA